MHLDGVDNMNKQKQQQPLQEQGKICATRVHAIGDCELRSLLNTVKIIFVCSVLYPKIESMINLD